MGRCSEDRTIGTNRTLHHIYTGTHTREGGEGWKGGARGWSEWGGAVLEGTARSQAQSVPSATPCSVMANVASPSGRQGES